MATIRLDIRGIPVSATGRRWLDTMYSLFPHEVVMRVLIDATTQMSKRGGRQVTRADLEAALEAVARPDAPGRSSER